MFQVKPFRGETLAALSYQITQEPPTPASQQNPLVPSACDRILSKALAKVSTDRYPRGKEFAQALCRVLQDIKKSTPQS